MVPYNNNSIPEGNLTTRLLPFAVIDSLRIVESGICGLDPRSPTLLGHTPIVASRHREARSDPDDELTKQQGVTLVLALFMGMPTALAQDCNVFVTHRN